MVCTALLQEQQVAKEIRRQQTRTCCPQHILEFCNIESLRTELSVVSQTMGELACVCNNLHAVLVKLAPACLITIARVTAADTHM